ncbi:hypothetical protein EVB27_023 [Rhizobium phage RHph_TM16]|nr:hypothetical protein EVB27_023 [Rhizobium phage RHph_TM16]
MGNIGKHWSTTMAMSFLKKAAEAKGAVAQEEEAPKKSGLSSFKKSASSTTAHTQAKSSSDDEAPSKPSGGMGFLKKGADAQAAFKQEQAKIEQNKEKQGKMFDFRMKEGEERRITFLDGDLGPDGILNITMFHEHNLQMAGGYDQYVCTAEVDTSQPCPLCAIGNKRYLVGLMTVIDHTPYTIKSGTKAGTTVENQRKLFKCKQGTIKILSKIASKKGGITGWTFDVSRSGGDKTPAVGDNFIPDDQWESRGVFAKQFSLKADEVQPANYDEEIIYKSPEELIDLGIGKSFTGVGSKNKNGNVDTGSLKNQL